MTYPKSTSKPIRNAPVTGHLADQYLACNRQRAAEGKGPLTVGSWLTYTLRGDAKRWAGAYQQRIERHLAATEAERVPSARNGIAWL